VKKNTTKISTPKDAKELAKFVAKLANEKIAGNIVVMDLTGYDTPPADFFVICSTDSDNQSQAILDFVLRQSKSAGVDKPKVEGESSGDWILIDFFDVVMHVMLAPIREYYNIEELWKDATFHLLNPETGRLGKKK
jgi:ribosome-associated protein